MKPKENLVFWVDNDSLITDRKERNQSHILFWMKNGRIFEIIISEVKIWNELWLFFKYHKIKKINKMSINHNSLNSTKKILFPKLKTKIIIEIDFVSYDSDSILSWKTINK